MSTPPGGPIRLLVVGARWGSETFLSQLFERLATVGFEVWIAGRGIAPADLPRHRGLEWLSLPGGSRRPTLGLAIERGRGLVRFLRRPVASMTRLRRARADGAGERSLGVRSLIPFVSMSWDVIYFPWNESAISHLELFDLDVPVLISCRGSQINVAPHNPERRSIVDGLRQTLSRATAVHCVSRDIARQARSFGLSPAKTHVIHPAVDTQLFHPAESAVASRPLRLVTTGSLIWRKGLEYALSAVRRLIDRGWDVRFDMIGSGPERQRLLYSIHDMGLDERVRLLGRLPPANVAERLRQSHVFLLSSLSEGISNAVLEAMATGLPVVTTDCGGMAEAVSNGVEGWLVETRNPEHAASALEKLLRDDGLRSRMGRAARRRVCESFRLEEQVQRFGELCSEVAASHPPGVGSESAVSARGQFSTTSEESAGG